MPEKEILGQGVVELVLDQSKYQADLKRLMSGGGGKGVAAGGASSGRTFIAAFSKVAIVGASKAGSHAGAAFAAAFNKKANANIKINAPKVGGGGSGKSSAFSGAMGAIKNIFGSMGGGSVVGLKSGASGGGGKPSAFSGAMNAVKKMFGSMGGGSVVGIKAGASVAAGEAIIGAFSKVGKAMFGVRAASAATSSRVVRDMKMQEMQSHRLSRGVDGLGGSFKRTQQSGLGFGGMMAAVAGGNMLANMVSSVTQKFKSFLTTGWQTSAMMETMGISFEKMVGSKSEADALLATLQKFAEATPLQFPDIMKAATGLLATQKIAKDQLLPTITKLTDAAAGSTEGFAAFPRVVRAVTQMLSKGKVQAEEMMQLAEAGIPAWDALATAMGMSIAEVQDLGMKGQLSFDAIGKLVDGLGKKFEGLADKQSKTWSGLMSTMRDKAGMVGKDIVEPFFKLAKVNLSNLLEWLSTDKATAFIKTITNGVGVVAKLVESALNSKIFKTAVLAGGVATAFTAIAVGVTAVWSVLGPVVLVVGALAGAASVLGAKMAKVLASPEAENMRKMMGEIAGYVVDIADNFTNVKDNVDSTTESTKEWVKVLEKATAYVRNMAGGAALLSSDFDAAKDHIGASIMTLVHEAGDGWTTLMEKMVEQTAAGANAIIAEFAKVARALGMTDAANAAESAAGNVLADIKEANAKAQADRQEIIGQYKKISDDAIGKMVAAREAMRRGADESDSGDGGGDGKGGSGGAHGGAGGKGKGDGFGVATVEGLHAELQKRLMESNTPAVVEAKKQTGVLEKIAENTGKTAWTDGASEKPIKAAIAAAEKPIKASTTDATPAAREAVNAAKTGKPVTPQSKIARQMAEELEKKAKASTSATRTPRLTDKGLAAREAVNAAKIAENTGKAAGTDGASTTMQDRVAAEKKDAEKSGKEQKPFELPDFKMSGAVRQQMADAGSFSKGHVGKNENFIRDELDARHASQRAGEGVGGFTVAGAKSINSLQAETPLEKHLKEKRAAAERSRERIGARTDDFASQTSPATLAQNEATKKFKERRFDRTMNNSAASLATRQRIDTRKAAESQVVRRDLPSSQMSDSPKSPEVLAKIEQRTQERQTKVANAFANRAKEKEATQAKIAAKTRAREGGAPFVEAAKPMTRFEQAKADQQAAFASGKEGKKAAFAARKEQLRAAFAESHNKGADMIDKLKPGAAAEPADPMMAVQQQQLAEMKLANTKNDLLVGAVKTVGEQVAASGGYAK